MGLDELDEKVEKAFKSPLVGEILFDDAELAELYKRIKSNHNIDSDYIPQNLLTAKRLFVVLVNLTRITEDVNADWKPALQDEYRRRFGWDEFERKFYPSLQDTFDQLKNEIVIFPYTGESKRYYNTFRCHSLVPRKSMYALYNVCLNYLTDNAYFRLTGNENNVSTGSMTRSVVYDPNILTALRSLVEYGRDKFETLVGEILEATESLLNNETIDTTDNYLNQTIVEWFSEIEEETATIHRLARTGSKRLAIVHDKPDFYYELENSGLCLLITGFNLGKADTKPDVNYEVYYNDECIKSESIRTYREEEFSSSFGFDSLMTQEVLIPFEDLKIPEDGYRQIKVVVKVNGVAKFDSGIKLKQSFILFNAKDVTRQIVKRVCKPGQYLMYCTSYSNTITRRLNTKDMNPINGTNLYYINAKDGDTIGTDDYYFTFLDNMSVNHAELAIRKNDATYQYRNNDYEIADEIVVKLPKRSVLSDYGLRFINCSDIDNKQAPQIVYLDENKADVIQNENVTIANIKLDVTCKTPYEVRLFNRQNHEEIIDEKRFIKIDEFHVFYSDKLFTDGSVVYKICALGEKDIDNAAEVDENTPIVVPYLNGNLVLNDIPLLLVKIGNGPYKLCTKYKNHMYCDEIPDICGISFKPDNIAFDVYVGDVLVQNESKFGSYVHSNTNYFHGKETRITIRPESKVKCKPVVLTTVHYKPEFITPPLVEEMEGEKMVVRWNPEGYIGPKTDDIKFNVEITTPRTELYKSTTKTYQYSMRKCKIKGFEGIGYGKYTYKIFLPPNYILDIPSESSNNEKLIYKYDMVYGRPSLLSFVQRIDFTEFIYTLNAHKASSGVISLLQDNATMTFSIRNSSYRESKNDEFVGELYVMVDGQFNIVDELSDYDIKCIVWRLSEERDGLDIRYIPEDDNDDYDDYDFDDLPGFDFVEEGDQSKLTIDQYIEDNHIRFYSVVESIIPIDENKEVLKCLTQSQHPKK